MQRHQAPEPVGKRARGSGPLVQVMTTMNISLNEDLKVFVEEQVVEHGYTSSSEYIRTLLRRERDITRLREKLLAGAEGPRHVMDEEYFNRIRSTMSRACRHEIRCVMS